MIGRDTGHALALAALVVALFIWSDSRLNGRMDELEAGQAALRAELAAVRAGLAATNERVARIEGVVAGALGRLFPGNDRLAQPPDMDAGD